MRATGGDPPGGTVTLVFTDIEGSTKLVQALGDLWTDLLRDHREIMRAAWSRWHGFEMGTEGDSFFVAFPSALDAVAAAVQAQRALDAHPWPHSAPVRVRIGMHTGTPTVVAGDYVGVDVHRAARVAAAGHGGQVLLSKATHDLVEQHLPSGVTLRDLGEHRLKDLEQPEWIHQLVIDGIENEFPALKSLETPNNLPVLSGGFVGRDRESAELEELLRRDDVRLVTLTGPGGTGKTRLALHVASQLLDRFRNGVYFVAIGPETTAAAVPAEIARALELRDAGSRDSAEALGLEIRDKAVFIVLDNFEHVLDAAPAVATVLLRAPRVKVIVTSRAPLHISGEREYHVDPLPVPRGGDTTAEVAAAPAAQLFVGRAQAVRADFALTDSNAAAVSEICRKLDGLPLAIELAAAKVKVLSPQQIVERLGSRLGLLKGGARDAPARQQALRDTIAWSYDLLDDVTARAFRALGAFPSGASLVSMEATVGDDALDALGSLVDHSLVRRSGERFGMLETIREFAVGQLEASGEAEAIRRRVAEEMLRIATEADAGLHGPEQSAWGGVFEAELDNMRSALAWSLRDGADPALGSMLAVGLGWFWYTHAFAVEGSEWLHAAYKAGADLPADVRAQLVWRLGILRDQLADVGFAAELFEQAVGLFRALGDRAGTAGALNSWGSAARNAGDAERARRLFEEALALRREIGDESGQATALYNLGCLELDEGDNARGRAMLEEGLALDVRAGDEWGAASDRAALGVAALDAGALDEARSFLARAVEGLRDTGDTDRMAEALGFLAGLAGAIGDAVRSARLAGAAEMMWGKLGIPLAPHDRARFERYQEKARSALGPEGFEQARTEGRSMTIDQAITFALAETG